MAGPVVICSKAPAALPWFKSKGKNQTLLWLSRLSNANMPLDAQDGLDSLPWPAVNRLGRPSTLPVRAERLISHKLLASPAGAENNTLLLSVDQQDGEGMELGASPVRIRASRAPVL